MVIEIKTRKWGNSVGIVIPKETLNQLNLKIDEEVLIEIHKKENVLKELFGALKFTKSSRKILNEVREDFEGKWM